eukprot:COSAG01_NODE_3076_length_6633_cov_13.203857_9_plen_72_part_00
MVYSESAAVAQSADPHQQMGGGNTAAASLVWHMWSQALIDGKWYHLRNITNHDIRTLDWLRFTYGFENRYA